MIDLADLFSLYAELMAGWTLASTPEEARAPLNAAFRAVLEVIRVDKNLPTLDAVTRLPRSTSIMVASDQLVALERLLGEYFNPSLAK